MNGMFAPVPERYRGVWARTLLETPTLRDDTTFVRWLQTAHRHADLRVPHEARLPPVGAAQLALQQGFCGHTEVTTASGDEFCQWHRVHDLQPPRGQPDIGRIRFETPDRLIETGVHADYLEVWERLTGSTGRSAVLEQGQDTLLLAGRFLMRVRPSAASHAFEISFGELAAGAWTITQSSLPALEGCVLPCRWQRTSAGEATVSLGEAESAWQVLEWDAADAVD
jgi:hypothetical protein